VAFIFAFVRHFSHCLWLVAGGSAGWLVADGESLRQNAGQVIANCVVISFEYGKYY
jgi:hypothetical protein